MIQRTIKSDSGHNNRVASLPNYPVVSTRHPSTNRQVSGATTSQGLSLGERFIENPLEDRGSAAVRLDFRTRRNIQRNILPDLVCDSVLSGFRRYNALSRGVGNEEQPLVVESEISNDSATSAPLLRNSGKEDQTITSTTEMGQRVSNPQKPNISFAWVLRGDPNSSSSSTTSSSSCSSSIYQNSSVSRTFTWDDKKRRQQCKSRKHHLFSEKNLKGSDLDDYRIVRKSLFETNCSNSPNYTNNNNDKSPMMDIDCLSLSTAETTTSISKCVDKATNLKKKRYRSKSKTSERNLVSGTGANANDVNERLDVSKEYKQWEMAKNGIHMPGMDCDTSEFDDYLKKCSLLCPANLPMVLVADTIMYQTRIGYQSEIFLPLGTLINGIFSVQDWIYIQLPGKVDRSGYVIASSCIPMGILPKKHRSLHRPRQTMQSCQTTSKSTDNLNLLLKPKTLEKQNIQRPQQPLSGTQFEALYARVIDKLRSHHLEESNATESVRKYSLSTQNLQKFDVLSNEAIKQESVEQKLESGSLK